VSLIEVLDPTFVRDMVSSIKSKTDNIDVALSTRASESTLSGLSGKFPSAVALADNLSNPTTTIIGDALLGFDGTYWRRVRVDTSGRLAIQNEPNLDVALSTRASESTLSGIKTQTDKLTFDASNYLQVNVKTTVNPSNLDVALSTRASESTLSGLSGKFPSAVALADNLSNPTTTIIGVANLGWDGTYWRRLATDTSSRLRTVVESVANPSNLDVALSTRASESTLSGLSGKFPSAVALSDSLSNPTTTIIGVANLGWDGTYWRRLATDTSSRLRTVVESVANPSNLDVALSTRASESTLSSFVGTPDSSPPSKGVLLLGYDGTYVRRVKTDGAGELQVDVLTVPNPSNLDVALSSRASELTSSKVRDMVIGSELGVSGKGAAYPSFDAAHWQDSSTYTVTETSWTEKTRCWFRPRSVPYACYHIFIGIYGYVAASGQTMYVRVRSYYRGVLASFTFTETSTAGNAARVLYVKIPNWDDPIMIEAYVAASGQTGYITSAWIDFIPLGGLISGYCYDISDYKPIRIDSDGYLLIKSV